MTLWLSPPTRRELTLLLFAFTVYVLFYNIDASLRTMGFSAAEIQQNWLSKVGLNPSGEPIIGPDGRKLPAWRDPLELEIYGDWEWNEGEIAGGDLYSSQGKGVGKYGAMWQSLKSLDRHTNLDAPTVDGAVEKWGAIPTANIMQHVNGYTVVKNLIIFNGTVYLVTDDTSNTPPATSISMAIGRYGGTELKLISSREALVLIPAYGARIYGTSCVSTDSSPDVNTLFALWRAYSSLDPRIDALGQTTLRPPHRLIFSHMKEYSDPQPKNPKDLHPRVRTHIGFPRLFASTVFPNMDVEFSEEWNDYQDAQTPFVIDTAVVANRQASIGLTGDGPDSLSGLFSLPSSEYWLEPMRRSLATTLGVHAERGQAPKRLSVTYIHNQETAGGLWLKEANYDSLLQALRKLGSSYDVHIISSQDDWESKLKVIMQSTVVLGAHGDHLFDSVFMHPTSSSSLLEFFPPNKFSSRNQEAVQEAGHRYIAFSGTKQYDLGQLPAVEPPHQWQEITIDVPAVIASVRSALKR